MELDAAEFREVKAAIDESLDQAARGEGVSLEEIRILHVRREPQRVDLTTEP